jgi:hypothetical protein
VLLIFVHVCTTKRINHHPLERVKDKLKRKLWIVCSEDVQRMLGFRNWKALETKNIRVWASQSLENQILVSRRFTFRVDNEERRKCKFTVIAIVLLPGMWRLYTSSSMLGSDITKNCNSCAKSKLQVPLSFSTIIFNESMSKPKKLTQFVKNIGLNGSIRQTWLIFPPLEVRNIVVLFLYLGKLFWRIFYLCLY